MNFDKQKRATFEKTPGTIVVDGRIQNEDKKSPLVLNILNQEQGAAIQSDRCTGCGSAGCFQGCGPEDPGCPFERDIPDIHEAMVKAGQVEESALKLLEKHSPEAVERLKAEMRAENGRNDAEFSETNARFPVRLFEVLGEFNRAAADKAQTLFDYHMKEAWKRSKAKGPMGDIYGRICPESLCEKTCIMSSDKRFAGFGSVTIKKNEAALWDYAWVRGWMDKIDVKQERPETVVVVGTGFAGYAAAEGLRESGFKVVMLEKNKAPGEPGHNQILSYKVNQRRFDRYYDRLRNSGVEIVTNTAVGAEGMTLKQIKDTFNPKAVILASGATIPKDHRLAGDGSADVVSSGEYLAAQQRIDREKLTGADIPDRLNAAGKVVALIGTGDTAVDDARVGQVHSAKEIILIARSNKIRAEGQDRAAYEMMKDRVEKSGTKLTIREFMEPREVVKAPEGGYVVRGANRRPENGEGPIAELSADMIISAIGTETGSLRKIYGVANLPVSNSGSLYVIPAPKDIASKTRILNVGAGYAGRLDGMDIFGAGQVIREGSSLAAICGRDGVDARKWAERAINNREAFDGEIKQISGHLPLELHYNS